MYLVVILVGLLLMFVPLAKLKKYHVMESWRQVDGVLTDLHIVHAEERIKYSSLEYVYPIAAYDYSVLGNDYRGNRVSLESKNVWVLLDEYERAPWKHWAKGARVTVYHDPDKPGRSALVPQLQARRRSHLLAVAVSGLLLVFAGVSIAVLGA